MLDDKNSQESNLNNMREYHQGGRIVNNDIFKTISVVQKYIDDNLLKSITLLDLAEVANYSIPQLERLFKRVLGVTPFVYIRKLRLTAAAKVLRDTNSLVIDTALDFVFDSHEGFTRAFSKEFGLSPFAYKANPIPLKYFIAYDVSARKPSKTKKENEQVTTVFTQVIEREARKVIIKRGIKAKEYFDYCNEVGCDIWGILSSIKDAKFEPAGYWLPEHLIKEGTSQYAQGVEVALDYQGVVPEGFEVIELPACKYMIFHGEEFKEEDFEEAIMSVQQAIKKFNPITYGYEYDETQPNFQLEPRGDRGYIEARPIKSII